MIIILTATLFSSVFGYCSYNRSGCHQFVSGRESTAAPGVTYYLDGLNGNDQASGRSAGTAWHSLKKLRDIPLKPGDSVLLRRGTVFYGQLQLHGDGIAQHPVVVDAYGSGDKPALKAKDSALYTVLIRNSSYLTLQHLDIENKGTSPLAGRTGVKLLCDDYGLSKCITLRSLDIHDVNGSLIKEKGGGSGLLVINRWHTKVSRYDSLLIEDCTIRRTARNGIIWSAPYRRDNWHPNTHVVIRANLLEEVPGDGIVPIGCDGTLIEYNVMRDCPEVLPPSEAAAGIWPWSCDNTVIQFNEVSGQKNQWDAQGYDADYNCRNTLIQFNYSHDNYGGMVLVCNDGSSSGSTHNIGNIGAVVRYNISVGDAVRPRPARSGKMFSPSIHIAGPVKNTRIEHNIIWQLPVAVDSTDRTMLESDSWEGFADSTLIKGNIFVASGNSRFKMGQSTNNKFEANDYLGRYDHLPDNEGYLNRDRAGRLIAFFKRQSAADPGKLPGLFTTRTVADGTATGYFVNRDSIINFFQHLMVDQNK